MIELLGSIESDADVDYLLVALIDYFGSSEDEEVVYTLEEIREGLD